MYCKKLNFNVLLGVQTFHFFKNCAKKLKSPKNSKILKNYGHFQIPHPQISLKQFSNICENVVFFFTM